ncbi:helix-turn-helix domain-containing protein [Ideonella sp. DXS22W]|uniref:Helix-turn-helix domain-containing protein n=1 Tax=Pseudaquabacterium inlustre TaxID=2984192 RepID=A0ABU9CLE6_9BURK
MPSPDDTARLIAPPAGLRGALYAVLVRDTRPLGEGLPPDQRINRFPALPYCGITWILHGGARLESPADHPDTGPLPPVFVSGPQTAPFASRNDGPIHTFCLVFHPQAFAALAGQPATALRDRHRPLARALPAEWAALDTAVRQASDDEARIAAAAAWLLPRWRAARGRLDQRLADLPQVLRGLPVRAVAAWLGFSPRQLERRSLQAHGLSPRELRTITRGHDAVLADQAAEPLADAAQQHGYADQPHMTREYRRLLGVSPAELRRQLAGDDESWWLYRLRRHGRL